MGLRLSWRIPFQVLAAAGAGSALWFSVYGAVPDGNDVQAPPRPITAADLEVVKTRFVHPKEDGFPSLVVTLRSLSDTAVVLHEAVFENLEVWEFPAPVNPHALGVSWTYQVNLGATETQRVELSQEIPARRADRFSFRLGTSKRIYPYVGHFLYLVDLAVIAKRDREKTPLGTFLARIPQPSDVQAYYNHGASKAELRSLRERARELSAKLASKKAIVDPDARAALRELTNLPAS